MLVSSSKDRSVRLWDVASGKEIHRHREHRGWVNAVAFAPDGQSVASAGRDQTVIVWDVFAERVQLRLADFGGAFFCLAYSPEGRILAAGSKDHTIHLWDLVTGKPLSSVAGHKESILSMSFAKNGKTLATGSEEGMVLLWDAASLPRWEKPNIELSPKEMERLWTDMAGDDAATTYRAMQALVAQPKQAVAFFAACVPKLQSLDEPRVDKLLADLDSDDFTVREKATEELLGGNELVEKALRKALKEKTLPLEAKRRVEQIIDTMQNRPSGDERRRRQGALEVLERIGSAEAEQALKAFADGPADAALTQEAKAALKRLAGRNGARP
jgi:hypothetical protein